MGICATLGSVVFASVSRPKVATYRAFVSHLGNNFLMDTIANMLTTITNAQATHKARVAVPYSRFKQNLATLLKEKGYVSAVRVQDGPQPKLIVTLAYDNTGYPRISGTKRISRPGQRRYASRHDLPYAFSGVGNIVVSTSAGLMLDSQARQQGLGGELICEIW